MKRFLLFRRLLFLILLAFAAAPAHALDWSALPNIVVAYGYDTTLKTGRPFLSANVPGPHFALGGLDCAVGGAGFDVTSSGSSAVKDFGLTIPIFQCGKGNFAGQAGYALAFSTNKDGSHSDAYYVGAALGLPHAAVAKARAAKKAAAAKKAEMDRLLQLQTLARVAECHPPGSLEAMFWSDDRELAAPPCSR